MCKAFRQCMNVKLLITLKSIDRLAFSSNGRCVLCTSQFIENYFSSQFIEVKMGGEWGVLVSKGSNMIGLEMSFHKKSLRKQMSLQVSYRVPGTHRITDKKHGGKIPSADPVGPSRSPMAWPSRPLRQVLF